MLEKLRILNKKFIEKSGMEKYSVIDKILADDSVWGNKTFVTILQKIVELRNDYNHAGFKKNPFSAKTVIKIIEKLLDGIEEVLSEI